MVQAKVKLALKRVGFAATDIVIAEKAKVTLKRVVLAAAVLSYVPTMLTVSVAISSPRGRIRQTRTFAVPPNQDPTVVAEACMLAMTQQLDKLWPGATVVASEKGL